MMKLRYAILLLMITAVGILSTQSSAADNSESNHEKLSDALTLEVNTERASNIFWDSETLETHKPILLSWRLGSAIEGKSNVEVIWRLLDANGKRVLKGSRKYDVEDGNYVAGSQLFTPKKRGAYLWVVQTTGKAAGSKIEKTASIPLAVIAAPQDASSAFLSIDAVAYDSLSTDFYQRLGSSVDGSSEASFILPSGDVNAAGRRRVMLLAKKESGGAAFSLTDSDATFPMKQHLTPRASANTLAQNVVMAHGVGATKYVASLKPHDSDAITFSSQSDNTQQLIPWERASAIASANRLLGNAQFVKELFPDTPAVYASLFRTNTSSVAVIWSNQEKNGRFRLNLPGAILLDANANQVDQANKKGDLKIPLHSELYYLKADVAPEILARAMRAASIDGIASVQAQILPFTQLPGDENVREIRVRLQNITPHACSGTVSLVPPKSWKLEHDSQQFVLQPGQWHIYSFPVTQVKSYYFNQVRANVRVTNGVTGNWSWRSQPAVATADNWTSKSTFALDGWLDDWKDATWMKATNDQFNRSASVAVRWDQRNLYIAAKVEEPRITARQSDEDGYEFWKSDGIQLGFGWRDEPWMTPSASNFRDTDVGILLSPFDQLENGTIQARVLTLWNPSTPFGDINDHVRWGGAVKGADSRIVYDPKKKETMYEAVIPLSALGNLNPQARLASATTADTPIRFSWIAHTFDGVAIEWSKAANVYPWWGNSGSFLPKEAGFLAAQTLLGFSQRGDVKNAQPTASPPADESHTHFPLPPVQPQIPEIPQTPIPPMDPTRPQNQVPSLPTPVPVQPIPPNLLPPAPPES